MAKYIPSSEEVANLTQDLTAVKNLIEQVGNCFLLVGFPDNLIESENLVRTLDQLGPLVIELRMYQRQARREANSLLKRHEAAFNGKVAR